MTAARPLDVALRYLRSGLSVIPIRPDGSKAPAVPEWKNYEKKLPSESDVRAFWPDDTFGIAIINGAVSGNLETIDFDRTGLFAPWRELVEESMPGLVDRLCLVRTPRDPDCYHVRYRCLEVQIPGNLKLAQEPGTDPKTGHPCRNTLIETRGEGGYALAPGSPPACHETGRTYEHVGGPPLTDLPKISAQERELLITAARSFDLASAAKAQQTENAFKGKAADHRLGDDLRPGDDYNQRGPDWPAILEPHGWVRGRNCGEAIYWRRPGKNTPGYSATTGYCHGKDGADLLAVFSSNAYPFEGPNGTSSCTCYSKFRAYAILNNNGNLKAAARELGRQGYGSQTHRSNGAARHGTKGTGSGPTAGPTGDGDKQSSDDHLTDVGNAARFIRDHGDDVRHCHPWGRWLAWDGKRWQHDQSGDVVRRAKKTVQKLLSDAAKEAADPAASETQKERAVARIKWALRSEDTKRIDGMLKLARCERPVLPADLDRESFLLNVENGTVDLRTGQLRPHRREDLLTKLAPVHFDPAAQCPRWLSCLDRVMKGNANLIGYLQRVLGYSLTASVSEQVLWLFHGTGANGKSTFISTVEALLGDYALQAVPELLLAKTHQSHPTERADLFGRRFVATVEIDQGKRLAESLTKQLTGGDTVNARWMKQDFFQFAPTFKIVLVANYKPVIQGTDKAIWRRVKLVPWEVEIPDDEKDKNLLEKLKAELSGILTWAIQGCLDWQEYGLMEPEEVRKATEKYQAEQDSVAGFIRECCFVHRDAKAKASKLFEAYQSWSGDKLMKLYDFGQRLRDKGYQSKRGHGGSYFYYGIRLTETESPFQGEAG
jgi:putative DNA primase/helicase